MDHYTPEYRKSECLQRARCSRVPNLEICSDPCVNRCPAILVTNVLHLGATVNREQGLGLCLEGMLVWRMFTNNSGLYTSAVPVTRTLLENFPRCNVVSGFYMTLPFFA